MTARSKPPFRADHVGSILRSLELKDAREKAARHLITAAHLKVMEDHEIPKIIRRQEEIGLQAATDGEYRRAWWHFDFFGMLDGVEIYEADHGIQFQGMQTKAHTKVMPKMTIPSPSVLHFRLEPGAVSRDVYPDRDAIFDDLAAAYQKAIRAFHDAGCRYLQFDDTAWAYLCSEAEMKKARDRGLDTDRLQDTYTRIINKALEAKPADMTTPTHVCRGNFRSTWIAPGGYEPVARNLLANCNYDGYFLEYDSERAGGFEPLRFLPGGDKVVVLGLVTSKHGALENKSDIKRQIGRASC